MTIPGPLTAAPTRLLAARYARALDIAAVVAVAGWHLAGAGSELAAYLSQYRSATDMVTAWLLLGAAIAAGAVLLLRGWRSAWPAWTLAAAAIVISTAVAAACPPGRMIQTDWAWGTAGWIGVLVLLRRPLPELGAFLSLEALATFAVLARDGLHRGGLAAFITVLAGSVSIQLAVAVAARALNVPARQAAEAATRQAEVANRQAGADSVLAARQARWAALHETAEPLLRQLADGTADPGDPAVRHSCAVEAARLRRLFAESDDVPDPLVHELHACADIAQRRGVAVDIETAAAAPACPPAIRRAATDLAISVLAAARSRARITVTGAGAGFIMSLLADAPADMPLPDPGNGLHVSREPDGTDVWVEARWNVG